MRVHSAMFTHHIHQSRETCRQSGEPESEWVSGPGIWQEALQWSPARSWWSTCEEKWLRLTPSSILNETVPFPDQSKHCRAKWWSTREEKWVRLTPSSVSSEMVPFTDQSKHHSANWKERASRGQGLEMCGCVGVGVCVGGGVSYAFYGNLQRSRPGSKP